jgi:type II secretory pathway component PulF
MDWQDRVIDGIIQAQTLEQAYRNLDKKFPTIIKVIQIAPEDLPENPASTQLKKVYWKLPVISELLFSKQRNQIWKGKISTENSALAAKQLWILLHAGFPVTKGLTLIEQTSEPHLGSIIKDIHQNIKNGISFSQAVAKHPNLFPPVCLAIIRSGETSGKLEYCFQEISELLEKQFVLKKKIWAALSYPFTLTVVSSLILFFFLGYLLPSGMAVYQNYHFQLPLATKCLLIVISIFHSQLFKIAISAGAAVFIFLYFFLFGTDIFKKKIDLWLLKIPGVKDLTLKICIHRSLFTLAFLIENGISITESCNLAADVSGNAIFSNKFKTIGEHMKKGEGVHESFRSTDLFTKLALDLIGTGESSGKLPELLKKASQIYAQEVDTKLDTLVKLLEPCFLVGLSGIVLLIAISAFMPMLTLSQHL